MSNAGNRADEITLVGVVGGATSLIHATLRVGGEVHVHDAGEELAIALDDGARIAVHAKPASVAVHPMETRRGRWDHVAETLLGARFANVAPGDHVDVRVDGWTIDPGARIAVRGRVIEHALVGGGMRAIPEERPRAVEARRIAIVDPTRRDADARAIRELDDADRSDDRAWERAMHERDEAERKAEARERASATREQRPPRPPKPWRFAAPILGGIGIAFALAALATWRDLRYLREERDFAVALVLLAFSTVLVTVAAAMWLSRQPFETTDEPKTPFAPTWAMHGSCFAALGLGLFNALVVLPLTHSSPTYASLGFGYAAVVGLGFLLRVVGRQRKMFRIARLLLLRRSGWIQGQVDAPGTAAERIVRYLQRERTFTVTERTQNGGTVSREERTVWYEGLPFTSRKVAPFRVRTAMGTVEVFAEHPLWGAEVDYLPVPEPDLVFRTRAAIEPGNSILVCGRTSRDDAKAVIRETGRESVILFAARRNARATLARMTMSWLGVAAFVLGLVAANTWYAVTLWNMDAP